MIVDYISDLHIDSHIFVEADIELAATGMYSGVFSTSLEDFVSKTLPETLGDILLIAGDLSNLNNYSIAVLKKYVDAYGEGRVFIVFGNHDLYIFPQNAEKYQMNSFNRLQELKVYCERIGVKFLDGDLINFNGIKIAGVPMWYDDTYATERFGLEPVFSRMNWRKCMADSRYILAKGFDYVRFSEEQKEKLRKVYKEADVVFSHIAPVRDHFPEKFQNPISTFFQFNGDEFLRDSGEKIWVFGHTHDPLEFTRGNVRFLCNPLGYRGEKEFSRAKSFSI